MARIDYKALVGEIRTNKKAQEYKIISYLGKKDKHHYFDIEFLATENLEGNVTYQQIKNKTAYDSKVLLIEKRLKKVERIKENRKKVKSEALKVDLSNFTNESRVLALDLATRKTGVTYAYKNEYKSYLLESNKDNFYDRAKDIIDRLVKFIDDYKVQKVVIEDIYLGLNSSVLMKLVTIRAFLLHELLKRNIEFQFVSAIKWRSHYQSLRGLTRTELKKESIKLYKNFTGKSTKSDDLAESFLICKYSIEN